jgi:predicted KAP-like P-loop ATPase
MSPRRREEPSQGSSPHNAGSRQQHSLYSADAPVEMPEEDRFSRWPFAKQVADVIAHAAPQHSFIIGIHAPWGEGKSSTVNFIAHHLKEHGKDLVVFRFDPWIFGDESMLVRSFFRSMGDALGRSLSSRKEKIGKAIEQYGGIVASAASWALPPIAKIGEEAKAVGEQLSTVELIELKRRIAGYLLQEKKRVVVLFDEIDRLTAAEIRSLFRLVRLTADFPLTTYILAFDETYVAEALRQDFSSAPPEMGVRYLEKIIQIPLRLPAVERSTLRILFFEQLEAVLAQASMHLSDNEWRSLVEYYTRGLEPRVQTPREVARLANVLAFSLPLLRNEVNVIDHILIEGIRLLYPSVYDFILRHAEFFVGWQISVKQLGEQIKERAVENLEQSLRGMPHEEQDAVKKLVVTLFPRAAEFIKEGGGYRDSEGEWSSKKRIASDEYFPRYFTYSVTAGDVSDSTVGNLVFQSSSLSVEQLAEEVRRIVTRRNVSAFLSKLERALVKPDAETAYRFALAISLAGSLFHDVEGEIRWFTPFGVAAQMVARLVLYFVNADQRLRVAKEILVRGAPLLFIREVFNWMRSREGESGPENLLTEKESKSAARVLVDRIRAELCEAESSLPDNEIASLLFTWSLWDDSTERIHACVKDLIEGNDDFAIALIRYFVWHVEGDSGRLPDGFVREDTYLDISKRFDAELLASSLMNRYRIDQSPDSDPFRNVDHSDEILARQFIYWHQQRDRGDAVPS